MCSGLDTEYQSLSVGMKSKMLTEKILEVERGTQKSWVVWLQLI